MRKRLQEHFRAQRTASSASGARGRKKASRGSERAEPPLIADRYEARVVDTFPRLLKITPLILSESCSSPVVPSASASEAAAEHAGAATKSTPEQDVESLAIKEVCILGGQRSRFVRLPFVDAAPRSQPPPSDVVCLVGNKQIYEYPGGLWKKA